MKITYFYRNHKVGYSIKKVSDLYVNLIEDKEIFEMPSQYASPRSILRNMWYTFKHRNKTGINHITGDIHYCIIPLMFCKTVLTVHDTSAYDCARGIKKILIKYLWFKLPLMLSTKVVCISEATKHSIMRFTKRKDIEVIYNALPATYKYSEKAFNNDLPNILIIGTAWNKNVIRTLKALESIKCHITIIGHLDKEQQYYLTKSNSAYTNKFDLTEDAIINEYTNADILCFCSIFEGFGMPIIEANAIGRTVLTSKIPPLTEIGGESVFYANPYSVTDINFKIHNIINNKSARDEHIKLGLQNIARFKAENIIKQYLNLYKNIK